MRLYMHPVSMTSRPVRLFIAENNIPCDEQVVDLMTGEHHKEPYVSLNPNRLVPMIEDGVFRLTESSAILKYLADTINSPAYPKDLKQRVENLDRTLAVIEQQSSERIPEERKRLQERIAQLVSDPKIVDNNRLELEIAILSEKLDVTEECVRFRSHNKMFLAALKDGEAAGRKLNFLIQEMNREANTIGSKVNDAPIAQLVVGMKEELEKVREQLQNIE